jgi:hypothetical protein
MGYVNSACRLHVHWNKVIDHPLPLSVWNIEDIARRLKSTMSSHARRKAMVRLTYGDDDIRYCSATCQKGYDALSGLEGSPMKANRIHASLHRFSYRMFSGRKNSSPTFMQHVSTCEHVALLVGDEPSIGSSDRPGCRLGCRDTHQTP